MFLLVFLLGSATPAAATDSRLSEHGIYISQSKMLVLVVSPSIDLDLSDLDLRLINGLAFNHCGSVKTLDLSNNWINELAPGIFSRMTSLERLSLANNDIKGKTISGAFRGLPNLRSLDLTHNPLSRILNNDNFVGLTNSCEIHIGISKNFRTLTPQAFGKIENPESKNRTIATEARNCLDRLDDRIFEFARPWQGENHEEPFSAVGFKMCTDNTTVSLVDSSNVTDTMSPNCRGILINMNGTKLKIHDDTITSFKAEWFRVRNTSVNSIYLHPRAFGNLTSELLNDLPDNIRFFGLKDSKLERLHKGVMANEHLLGLDLSMNFIRFIEKGAFDGLNVTHLNLGFNPLVTLDYVPNLPETLLSLNLEYNAVGEIPADTFSHLKDLLALNLKGNRFNELVLGSFNGLVSLQWLDLSLGMVTTLRANDFQNLSKLYYLDLRANEIGRLESGVFNGLDCLAELDLSQSHLTSIDGGVFQGLTDSLQKMDLHGNHIETLRAGTFVNVPKFNLSLKENRIRKIEKGTFNVPYLKSLDLRENGLTTIEKGSARNLGNLADEIEIRLGFNKIQRLDNGALGGLPTNAHVNLAQNPIEIIQAGVFDDS